MSKLKVKPKIDIAFKKIFADNEELLKHLIKSALNLQSAEILVLKPTEITPFRTDEKFCRFDIRAEVDGQDIDIEIQLAERDDFRARAEYYSSLLFTHLKSGKDYNELPKTVVICFIDYNAFGCEQYHSKFVTMEETRHELLTYKKEIHFFELKKIPHTKNAKNELEYWLNFISAETEEDIDELKKTSIDVIQTALTEVNRLNADEEFIQTVAAREVALREEASALNAAEKKGIREANEAVAKKMLKFHKPIEEIMEYTGLTADEIKYLK